MKILGICGSLRQESWNRKLLVNTLEIADGQGAETDILDLKGVPMFNPDDEGSGTPSQVAMLREAVEAADAVIIACPEHNGSMSAALKNAIEWLSRDGNSIGGRVFYLMGTSPGRSGCTRMHVHASYSLESEGGLVLHQPRALLPQVEAFMDSEGNITNPAVRDLLESAVAGVIQFSRQLAR